jgi:hypothetical protein
MSETKGLYQVPDVPDDAPQGSVSQPVSALGRADAPLRECAHCGGAAIANEIAGIPGPLIIRCSECRIKLPIDEAEQARAAWNRRDGEAARVAEAVAAERARIERELTLLMENTGGLVAWVRTLKVIRGAPAYGTTSAEEYPAQPPGSGDAP